jgi:prophage antirepressor-like protein
VNEIQIFENTQFGRVRSVILDNTPWFVGKDIAECLGYKNTKDAIISHVDPEDRRVVQRSDFPTFESPIPKDVLPVVFVNGDIPNRGLTVINESGMYALIFGSKLPEAKIFKRWVTSEVLPSIRKTGAYATDARLLEAAQLLANCKQRAALPTLISMMSQYTGVPLTASTGADQRSGETAHVRTWIESMSISVTDIMKSPTTELYAVYSAWAKSVDLREAVSRKAFHAILRDIYGLSQKNRQGKDGKRYFRV